MVSFSKYKTTVQSYWPNEVVPTDHWFELKDIDFVGHWYSELSYGVDYYFFSKFSGQWIISYFTLATLSKDGYLIPRENQDQSLAYRELGDFSQQIF